MKNADKAPDTFRQAEELLDARPLPLNVVEQLGGLRLETPKEWRVFFDNFYGAALASADDPGPHQ